MMAALVTIFAIAACNEENTPNLSSNTGRLNIELTDAPINIDLVQEANVTITRVEARRALDSAEADSTSPFIELSSETETYNLLELRNGVTETLVDMEVPAGQYDLIRLYVDEASLALNNGESYSVKVPSGKQTGIKIFIEPDLQVQGGLTSNLLLDIDISKSFIMKGNMNTPAGIKGFNFKPVIRAVNKTTAGRLEGMVSDTAQTPLEEAAVWIEKDTVVSTTYSDTTGGYAILGIPEGTYDLYAAKQGYDTVRVNNIDITPGNHTTRDLELTPTDTTTTE